VTKSVGSVWGGFIILIENGDWEGVLSNLIEEMALTNPAHAMFILF
jgi:hypothetical protein